MQYFVISQDASIKHRSLYFSVSVSLTFLLSSVMPLANAMGVGIRHSAELPSVGTHGFELSNLETDKTAQLRSFADIGGNQQRCAEESYSSLSLATDGWLQLSAKVPENLRISFEQWLETRPFSGANRTNLELLKFAVQGISATTDSFVGERGRPAHVDLNLQLLPSGCSFDIRTTRPLESGVVKVEIPLLIQAPAMLQGYKYPGFFRWFTRLIAHEITHVTQLMPFNLERRRWFLDGDEKAINSGYHDGQPRMEVGALLVEHCIQQTIFPSNANDSPFAQLWLDDRKGFDELMRDYPLLKLDSLLYNLLSRSLGKDFLKFDSPSRSPRLFALCAMAVQRPDSLLQSDSTPSAEERAAGEKALNDLRVLGAPLTLEDSRP